MIPERLYKYIPSEYAENMIKRGELLFRNLTYFKQYEDEQQGDPLEGHHRDNPDNDIVLSNLSTGKLTKGDLSILNTTDSDLIYVFCTSTIHSPDLYRDFKSNACIEITDVEKFILRIRVKLKHLISCHKAGLLHGDVKYYAANKVAEFNIEDPKELAFAKDEMFKHQHEYRIVFGAKKAFNLVKKIIYNDGYDFKADAMKGTAKEKLIKIGDISDFMNVKYIDT